MLTLNLLESFAMKLAHCFILLAQECNTSVERVCNAKVPAIELVLAIGPLVAERFLHLLNGCDQAPRFFCHVFLLPDAMSAADFVDDAIMDVVNLLINKLEMVI